MPRDVAALVALIDEFSDSFRFDITEFRLFIRDQKNHFRHFSANNTLQTFVRHFKISKSDTNLVK